MLEVGGNRPLTQDQLTRDLTIASTFGSKTGNLGLATCEPTVASACRTFRAMNGARPNVCATAKNAALCRVAGCPGATAWRRKP